LDAACRLMPSFRPASLIDLCAGPGTATLAALERWPELEAVTLVDTNAPLLDAARQLLEASGSSAASGASLVLTDIGAALAGAPKAELVVMSYALVELPEAEIAALSCRIFEAAGGLALFVEPGTPDGYRRLMMCREALIGRGACIVAPCPHALPCPMQTPQ